MRPFLTLLLVFVFAGCDTEADRPLTLAERVAGTWEVVRVKDGALLVTQEFERTIGSVEFEFESVGCCAATAAYRLTVTSPDGEVTEVMDRYRVNDNPDTPDFFILFTRQPPDSILLQYDLDSPFNKLALIISGVTPEVTQTLETLGLGYPFRESVRFELARR